MILRYKHHHELPTTFTVNLKIVCIAIVAAFSCASFAEESTAKREGEKDLIKANEAVAKQIDTAATNLDKALAGSYDIKGDNRTQVTIRNQMTWPEGGPFGDTPHLDLRLSLPNLEKKWKLKFTTYDQDQESRGINRDRLKTEPIRDNYTGGFQFLQKLGNIDTSFEPRLEYRDRLEVSYFLRMSSAAEKGFFRFHPELQLFARSDTGIGEFVGLNTDFRFSDAVVLTAIDEQQYQDQLNLFSGINGLSVAYQPNDLLLHTFSLIFESSSRPNYHLDRFSFAWAFSQKLIRNVFHYTIMPYVAFPRNVNYRVSPGVNGEIDVIF